MPEPQYTTIIGPAGIVEHIEAGAPMPAGYHAASPAEEQEARAQARGLTPGVVAETVAAGAAGVGRGFTLGATDVVFAETGGPGAAEYLRGLRERHPIASGVGEIGGAVVGLGKARAAIGAIPAVARAAAPATRLGRVALGTSLGTLEGAAIGAQQAITESVLTNADLTGERLWASVGHGALWGGSISGALSGTGQLIGAGLGRIRRARIQSPTAAGVEAVAEGAFGEAAPGVGQRVADAIREPMVKAAGTFGTGGREAIEGLLSSDRARRLAREGLDRLEDFGGKYTAALDDVLSSREGALSSIRNVPMKHSKVVKLVGAVDEMDAIIDYDKWVKRIDEVIDDARRVNPQAYGYKAGWKQLESGVAVIRKETFEAVGRAKNAAERKAWYYIGGDRLKREIGTYTSAAEGLASRKPTVAARKTFEVLDELYHTGRQQLENASVWGPAGLAQKAINKPISTNIAAGEVFYKNFTTKGVARSLINPWRNAQVADPAKIDAYVKGLTSPQKNIAHQAQREWLKNLEDAVDAIDQVHELSPGQAKHVVDLKDAAARMRAAVSESEEAVMRVNQMRSLEEASRSADIGLLARLPFMSPARTIRHLSAAESIAARAKGKTDGRLTKFFKGATRRGDAWSEKVRRPLMTAAVAASARQRFDWHSEQVQQVAANREAVRRQIEAGLGELAHGAPAAVAASLGAANRSIDHLLKHLPAVALPAYPLAGGNPTPPAPIEIDRWLSRARALEDPSSLLDDAADGTMSPDALDAVKDVYPETLRDIQDQLMDGLLDMAAGGKTLPYHQLLGASTLLGQPLHPTQDPQLVAKVAEQYAADQQPQPPDRPSPRKAEAPNISKFFRTGLQRAEDKEY